MPRYIEREKFLKKCMEAFGHFVVLVKAIEEISDECATADVVPKSEVAREIFGEIDKRIASLEYRANTPRKTVKVEELKAQCDWILHEVIPKTLAELKKKYTEGE